jgi:hypothetical protein
VLGKLAGRGGNGARADGADPELEIRERRLRLAARG